MLTIDNEANHNCNFSPFTISRIKLYLFYINYRNLILGYSVYRESSLMEILTKFLSVEPKLNKVI